MSVNTYDKNTQTLSEVAGGRVIVDPVPTENSVRPVSSGGVFEALEGKVEIVYLGQFNDLSESVFANRVVDAVKNLYDSAEDVVYTPVCFWKNGAYIGNMVYNPVENGYIGITAHPYYNKQNPIEFGIHNGAPFYKTCNMSRPYEVIGSQATSDLMTIARNVGLYVAERGLNGTTSAEYYGTSSLLITACIGGDTLYFINVSIFERSLFMTYRYDSSTGAIYDLVTYSGTPV